MSAPRIIILFQRGDKDYGLPINLISGALLLGKSWRHSVMDEINHDQYATTVQCGVGTVGAADFDHAILRAVAGIEKKRSILMGVEKQVVAKHEAGHALVATAVQILIPTSAPVEKLSIIPRTGGALG